MDNLEVPTPPHSQPNTSKAGKVENVDNPLGLDGLEFVEFSSNKPEELEKLFLKFGFSKIGQHKRKNVGLYRQNQVNFIINNEPGTFAAKFAKGHGPSICATAFRVKNAQKAFDAAVLRGARPIEIKSDSTSHSFPAVYGIGDSAIYFIDRYKDRVHYDEDFRYLQSDRQPKGKQIYSVDHLTNNVPRGDLQKWCDFYRDVFNFREVQDFEGNGQTIDPTSRVMRSPCGKITIPINEPSEKKNHVQEYLDEYSGSGIQHIAFATNDIVTTVSQLDDEKIAFVEAPASSYETVMERVPELTENVQTLQKLGISVDGDGEGYLLQIFTKNLVGPIFFEIIQRKNYDKLRGSL